MVPRPGSINTDIDVYLTGEGLKTRWRNTCQKEEDQSRTQGHKAYATKTIRQSEDILVSETPDKERLSLLQLTLNEKLQTIKGLDSEVIDLIEIDEALASEIEQADDYKESTFNTLIRIDRIVKAPPTRGSLTLPTNAPTHEIRAPPPHCRLSHVRLPKLQFHSFGGDQTKFLETLDSAVHNNDE